MDSDEALGMAGGGGCWQIFIYLLVVFPSGCFSAWDILSIVFTGASVRHHCRVAANVSLIDSVPGIHVSGAWVPDRCRHYVNFSRATNMTQTCSNGWTYDTSQTYSIVPEWDLVCTRDFLAETTQTLQSLGMLAGGAVISALSDMYGRKKVCILALTLSGIVGVITAFVTNYYAFAVLRFATGVFSHGMRVASIVFCTEMFPAKLRLRATMGSMCTFGIGMMILSFLAYMIRHWRHLQLAVSVPHLGAALAFLIVPESVPWLLSKGKNKEAMAVLKRAAKWNNIKPQDTVKLSTMIVERNIRRSDGRKKEASIQELHQSQELTFSTQKLKRHNQRAEDEIKSKNYLQVLSAVFRSSKLRLYFCIMTYIWLANILVYYGLSLSTASLVGNVYLNFFLYGVVEFPSYIMGIICLNRFGRKTPLCIFHALGSVCLAGFVLLSQVSDAVTDSVPTWVSLAFVMTGKFFVNITFSSCYLITSEIFPTNVRSVSVGASMLIGRIGQMIAPFSTYAARHIPWLPGSVFSAVCAMAGLLIIVLPETVNRPLPQTIDDAERASSPAVKEGKSDSLLSGENCDSSDVNKKCNN